MPKITVDLDDEREDPPAELKAKRAGADAGAGLPSPHKEKWREYLRHKKQFNIGRVPEEITKRFDAQAIKKGMTKIEYFYYLLKNGDKEIFGDMPEYDKMDRRFL